MVKMEKEQKQKQWREQQGRRWERHTPEERTEARRKQHGFRSREPEKEPYIPVRAGVLSREEAERAKEVLENTEKENAEEEMIRKDMAEEDTGTGEMKAKAKADAADGDRKIRYKLSEGLKMRRVAGQTMIVPIGSAVRTIGQTAVLNPEAAFLVSQMKEWFTPEEVVRKGLEVYDADEDKLRADVLKLVETLFRSGMLIEDAEDGRGKRGRASGIVRVPTGKDLPGPGSL